MARRARIEVNSFDIQSIPRGSGASLQKSARGTKIHFELLSPAERRQPIGNFVFLAFQTIHFFQIFTGELAGLVTAEKPSKEFSSFHISSSLAKRRCGSQNQVVISGVLL